MGSPPSPARRASASTAARLGRAAAGRGRRLCRGRRDDAGQLGERLVADRLDQRRCAGGALGGALRDAGGARGLDRDHAPAGRDGVVELARDAGTLGDHRGARLLLARLLEPRGLLAQLGGQLVAGANREAGDPGDGDAAEDGGDDGAGMDDGGVQRRADDRKAESGDGRPQRQVRADRVRGADHGGDARGREAFGVDDRALDGDRGEHGGDDRDRPGVAPVQRDGDGQRGERRGYPLTVGSDGGELDHAADRDERRKQSVEAAGGASRAVERTAGSGLHGGGRAVAA
jgi:hypothetical protein